MVLEGKGLARRLQGCAGRRWAGVALAAVLVLCASASAAPCALAASGAGAASTSGGAATASTSGDAVTPSTVDLLEGCVSSLRSALGTKDGESIYASSQMTGDEATCQWIALDFYRLGEEADTSAYLEKLRQHVTDAYANPSIKLDKVKSTEWNRTSLVVHGLGGDPTSFGTDANGNPIDLVKDGSYGWQQTSSLGMQGSNGWIYALEVYDTCGVEIPSDALYPEDMVVSELVAAQSNDGGFGLSKGSSDVDLTAMAICALAPHANEPDAATAIDKAVDYLSAQEGADGRFTSVGVDNSESSSQVIMALCALQINPDTDSRFVKPGGSALDGLLSFRRDDGSFSHSDDDDTSSVELLATEQATRALTAVYELECNGDGNVYTQDVQLDLAQAASAQEVQDASGKSGASGTSPVPWVLGGIVAGCAIVAIVVLASRKRKAA